MRVARKHLSVCPVRRRTQGGYLLMEVVLALTIFGIAVMALANALNEGAFAAGELNRENSIRIGLRSFIEEVRRKEVNEMNLENFDERLQCSFSSTVDTVSLENKDGNALADLYMLHAKANWGEGTAAQEMKVDLYLYKSSTSESSSSSGSTTPTTTTTSSGTGSSSSPTSTSGGVATPSSSR